MTIVAKFGVTSVATAESIRHVAHILRSNGERTIAVVSAPGHIHRQYEKMTDALVGMQSYSYRERTMSMMRELDLGHHKQLAVLAKLLELESIGTEAARISFGEWFSAYLLADVSGYRLIDAQEVINFHDTEVQVNIMWREGERVVIPGFYGYDVPARKIKLFPRGGSDITAALIAEKIRAERCERWTDVSGVYSDDPRYYHNATHYPELSYSELLRLADKTFQVFHPEGITPLQTAGIPLHILNTFAPQDSGTRII